MKYKMREKTKSKRMPTVKKELSTQKEILVAGNETQDLSKDPLPAKDPVNRLNSETDSVHRRSPEKNEVRETRRRLLFLVDNRAKLRHSAVVRKLNPPPTNYLPTLFIFPTI